MSAPPLKVLVVDDEPPIRKLLRMGLGTQGYHIIDAPNAKAALELMAAEPDLVILDLGLPDMQGLELLRQIRQRREDVPIVVLSSRGDEVAKVEAFDLGADDYVTKPFGMEELLARMRTALRHQIASAGRAADFQIGRFVSRSGPSHCQNAKPRGEAFTERIRAAAAVGPSCRKGTHPQFPA